MRAFYHPDQVLHDPQQYIRNGLVVAAKDVPIRTQKLLDAVKKAGMTVEQPKEQGKAPALTIHTPSYIEYLETCWDRWQQLPERGIEVWPNAFPYWSGRVEEDHRPPCPAKSVVAQTGWYMGDLAAAIGAKSWTSILRSSESAVAATDAVLAGDPISYSLCRPSGHHARTDRAQGLCFLNNAAIAAQRLRGHYKKVAILDIDTHHGDGTQQIFYNRDDVLTISIHTDPENYYPWFTGYASETGHGKGKGFNLNLPLPQATGAEAFLPAVDQAVKAMRAFGAEALVLALGFDAHKDDPVGVLKMEAADFGDIAVKIRALGLPAVVVQEGGYAVEAIGDCLYNFLEGLKR